MANVPSFAAPGVWRVASYSPSSTTADPTGPSEVDGNAPTAGPERSNRSRIRSACVRHRSSVGRDLKRRPLGDRDD